MISSFFQPKIDFQNKVKLREPFASAVTPKKPSVKAKISDSAAPAIQDTLVEQSENTDELVLSMRPNARGIRRRQKFSRPAMIGAALTSAVTGTVVAGFGATALAVIGGITGAVVGGAVGGLGAIKSLDPHLSGGERAFNLVAGAVGMIGGATAGAVLGGVDGMTALGVAVSCVPGAFLGGVAGDFTRGTV